MKSGKVIWCLFLLSVLGRQNSDGQNLVGNTYAIYWNGNSECFTKLSQETGTVTIISTIPNIKWVYNSNGTGTSIFQSTATFNNDSGRYIFLGQDTNFNTHIYTINACDGRLLYYPTVSEYGFIDLSFLQYSSTTKEIYILGWDIFRNHEYFCTINPYNGLINRISIVPGLKSISVGTNESAFMPDSNLLSVIAMDSLQRYHIYTIDIFSGNLKYRAPLVPLVYDLEYDSVTKNMYGIYNTNAHNYEFVTVNRHTGSMYSITPLSKITSISMLNGSAFNTDSEQYIAESINSNVHDEIYSITPSNGNVVYSPTLTRGITSELTCMEYGHIAYFNPSINPNDSVCLGSSVSLNALGGSTYSWSPSLGLNSDIIANPVAGPTTTTTYTVTISNSYCSTQEEVTIKVKPTHLIHACCDTSLTPGGSAHLSASGSGSYLWNPPTGLSCDTCADPIASPDETTTYTLTSDSGCTTQSFVTIEVPCGNVFVPDVFSPSEAHNNILYVRSACIVSIEFMVFDRWGNKVFESQNLNDGWDGTYKGQAMSTATYIWSLKATLQDGTTLKKKGNVTLVR